MKSFFIILFSLYLFSQFIFTSLVFAFSNSSQDPSNSKKNLEQIISELSSPDKAQWAALLYLENQKHPIISDPKFYLNQEFISAEQEMLDTLRALGSSEKNNLICRFPARVLFIKKIFQLKDISFEHCSELNQFSTKAPAEQISVVFASENISMPSSMMGHIYLKIEGTNDQNIYTEHSISYFTEIQGFNFIKLIFESLITGKQGYYALSPHQDNLREYIFKEKRNVWEYKLKLDHTQRKLLHLHLFELKKIDFTYYFHKFNCASLIYRMITVVDPKTLPQGNNWTTPLDVVRLLKKNDLIHSQRAHLANKWKIKSLLFQNKDNQETIQSLKNKQFKSALKYNQQKPLKDNFIQYQLAISYNQFLFEEDLITKTDLEKNKNIIQSNKDPKLDDAYLDLKQYKNPTKTKSLAQFSLGQSISTDIGSQYNFSVLPASHLLLDDSSQYLSESELAISKFDLSYVADRQQLLINNYYLYSATSFQPSDSLTGGLSGKFEIAYRTYRSLDYQLERDIIVEGALGKTYRLHHDFDYYFLAGARTIFDRQLKFSPYLQSGGILRAVFDMKSHFFISKQFMLQHHSQEMLKYNFEHILDLDQFAIVFFLNKQENNKFFAEEYGINFKKYF